MIEIEVLILGCQLLVSGGSEWSRIGVMCLIALNAVSLVSVCHPEYYLTEGCLLSQCSYPLLNTTAGSGSAVCIRVGWGQVVGQLYGVGGAGL